MLRLLRDREGPLTVKNCVIPPDGEALWKRVESLLRRRDRNGQPLVTRITTESDLQALLAQKLGRAYGPGFERAVCPTEGDGLLVGYPPEPQAVLHRTPRGTVHLVGVGFHPEPGAEIDRIVAALEVGIHRRGR